MSNVNGASLFGSAVVGAIVGAAVGTLTSTLCEKVSDTQEKHSGTIENVCIIAGAALGITIYLANNES